MQTDYAYQQLAFKIFADFSVSIAVPSVLSAILGKFLDQKFQTTPFFIMLFLSFAFISTGFLLVRRTRFYKKQFDEILLQEEEDPKKKKRKFLEEEQHRV